MCALQDITNRGERHRTINNNTTFTPTVTRRTVTSTQTTLSSSTRRSVSSSNLLSRTYGSRSRRVRFPSRLSVGSLNNMSDFDNLDESFTSHSCCFLSMSFAENSHDHANNNFEFTSPKKKRLSIPAVIDGKRFFQKLNLVSRSHLVDLVHDVSKISIVEQKKTVSVTQNLKWLLQNIHRAMPERVYGATRDAVSFKRIEPHLLLFKQECLRQCRVLFNDARWDDLLDYIFISWVTVSKLPVWENASHNTHKQQIFSIMASYCRKGLKLACYSDDVTVKVKEKVLECCKINGSMSKVLKDIKI